MSLSPPPTYDAHSTSSISSSTLKPYLELPHLLSLTWLAYPILSLLFIAFRLQLSLSSAQDSIASAKTDLVASCKAAEKAATAAASMPRYMAVATNEQFADAVNASMNAARATLVLALTIMEAIINFIIDIYRSTFLCFVELVVRGALSLVISAVQELSDVVKSTASGIQTAIEDSISTANSAITTAINAINKVNPFNDISAPQIPSPDLSALDNVTLPSSFTDSLTKLNSSLPTFSELKDKIEAVIDTPFELLKKDINDTFGGLSFNSSILPVPQQNTLVFCDQLDTSVVDDLGQDLIKVAKIGTIIIILLALVLIGLNCLLEWYKWRCQQNHLQYTREAWTTDPTLYYKGAGGAPQVSLTDHNLLMLQAQSAHPLITRILNQMSARLHLSPTAYTNISWFLHYIFHPPALACFLIGFFGLLSVQIQLAAIGPLEAKYSERAASTATDFSNTIATSINASMYNQSAAYATSVNAQVDDVQSTINDGLFGWVNSTTTTLNDTVNAFYQDIQDVVSDVFNGTILEQPVQEFIQCFIGSKVDAIEDALTFLHDNLHVDMPRVNDSVLVLSPQDINEASQPIAAAAIGDGSDGNGGIVGKLVNAYEESLRKERIMFGIFMGLWGFVVLMALCILLWHLYGKAWVEKRKRRRWERQQRSGIDGLVVPFRSGQPQEKSLLPETNLRSFTPLPDIGPRVPGSFPVEANVASNVSTNRGSSPDPAPGKSWENFFGSRKRTFPTISKPMKMMSIVSRKPAKEEVTNDQDTEERAEGQRNTAWFSRVATMLGRKSVEPEHPETDEATMGRSRPNLRISIESASTIRQQAQDRDARGIDEPPSRWSTSPELTRIAPWIDMLSPTRRSFGRAPPPVLPPRPSLRQNVSVPDDVNSVYESSQVEMDHSALAPPLHHGFTGLPTLQPTRPPALSAPKDRHRRSSSVPAWKMPIPPTTTAIDGGSASVTPVTRLLTTTHARQSSNVNPFATPFDDEHRVTVEHAPARKSYSTNPFTVVAI